MNSGSHLPAPLRTPWPLAAAAAAVMAVLVLLGASPFAELDRRWNDLLLQARFRLHLAPKPDERVFVLGLDADDFLRARSSAAEYDNYARLVDMLAALEVRVIAFDLILMRGTAEDAEKLRASLLRFGNGIVGQVVTRGARQRSFPFSPDEPRSGLINADPDPDGVHRRYTYGLTDGFCAPSLALAAYLRYLEVDDVRCAGGALRWKELSADGASIVERNLPSRGSLLNFRAPFTEPWDRGFRYLTLTDLRKRAAESGKGLPGKGDIVLVASMVGDAGPTPFNNYEPLITLHATALTDLLQSRVLHEAGPLWILMLACAGLAAVASASQRSRGNLAFFLMSGAAFAMMLSVSFALLLFRGVVLPAMTPVAFAALGLLMESGRKATAGSIETARTRETLGRYFSPRILEEVLANPDQVEPREVELTVLLTDVRNFTTITERLGVRRTFDMMNEVFEVETGVVLDLDGSMEHFVGDQFVAYWGAPQAAPDATDRAITAAHRIVQGLERIQTTWEPELASLFGFGVAVHSGKALVGNKGSRRRLDYGILGDIVNAAARIESLTRHYGVRQIASKRVIEQMTAPVRVRFLDRIRVKGKAEPLDLFELVYDASEDALRLHRQYEAAWECYAQGRFVEATELLEPLSADQPSRVLLARCVQFMKERPERWDGIFQFAEK